MEKRSVSFADTTSFIDTGGRSRQGVQIPEPDYNLPNYSHSSSPQIHHNDGRTYASSLCSLNSHLMMS